MKDCNVSYIDIVEISVVHRTDFGASSSTRQLETGRGAVPATHETHEGPTLTEELRHSQRLQSATHSVQH